MLSILITFKLCAPFSPRKATLSMENSLSTEKSLSPQPSLPADLAAKGIPFLLVHLLALATPWFGVRWELILLCLLSYYVRMFAITGGLHRYFAHRTFKTSRPIQFLLALLAETSSQKGVLWWAGHH